VEVGHRAGEEEAEVGHRAGGEEAEEEAGEEAEDHGEAEAEEAGEEAGEEAEEEAENNTLRIQAITTPTIGLTVAAEVRNRAGEVRNKRVGGADFFQTAGEVENFRKQVLITHRRHPMTVAAALPTKRGGVASIASRNK